jgi:hypothetical protein
LNSWPILIEVFLKEIALIKRLSSSILLDSFVQMSGLIQTAASLYAFFEFSEIDPGFHIGIEGVAVVFKKDVMKFLLFSSICAGGIDSLCKFQGGFKTESARMLSIKFL